MTYSFIDKEVYLQPPYPAVKASGSYSETTNSYGAMRHGKIKLHLEGTANVNKSDLIAIGTVIVNQRLIRKALIDPNKGNILVNGAITEQLWEPVVDMEFDTMIRLSPTRLGPVALDPRGFDAVPPGSESDTPADPGIRGTAYLGAIANALQDPCIQQLALRTGDIPAQNALVGETQLPIPTILFGTLGPTDTNALVSTEDPYGVYTEFEANVTYENPQNVHQLAIAAPVQAGQVGAQCAFVQTGGPVTRVVHDWIARRVGAQPDNPDRLSDTDSNLVLLEEKIKPASVTVAADGVSLEYQVTGQYIYGVKDVSKLTVQHPVPPWINNRAGDVQNSLALLDQRFIQGVFDAAPPMQQNILVGQLNGGGDVALVAGGQGPGGQGN
jgi:hypothetical protein